MERTSCNVHHRQHMPNACMPVKQTYNNSSPKSATYSTSLGPIIMLLIALNDPVMPFDVPETPLPA